MAMYRRFFPLLIAFLLVLAALPLAGDAAAASIFDPHSPSGTAIARLFWLVLGISAIVFIVVEVALIAFAVRYRQRGEAGEPRQIFGNRRMELLWTGIPAVTLAIVFVIMVATMRGVSAGPANDPNALTIEVIGHQWWWEYRYPGQQFVTANELHLPAGQTVHLRLGSADVIHDFWVPQLGRKMDLIPGQTNDLWVQVDAPGVYAGSCAEYCGAQHAGMRLRVVADTPTDFAAWVAGQQRGEPSASGDTAAIARGRELFFQGAGNCASCHAIAGTTAKGNVGPDLSHVGGRATLAAGVITNTPDTMQRWLLNPQAIKPGNRMPNLRLSEGDAHDLAAYLESLK
jgi:cytochrome c oxidase subunit 2